MKFETLVQEELDIDDIENNIKMLKNQLDQIQLNTQARKKREEALKKQNEQLLAQIKKSDENAQQKNVQIIGTRKNVNVMSKKQTQGPANSIKRNV